MVYKYNKKGFVLLEAVMAVAVIGIAFGVLLSLGALSIKTSSSLQNTGTANLLLKEAIEATRSFRDGNGWTTFAALSKGTPYHSFLDASNKWNLTPNTETTGIFTRQIIFGQTYRDVSGNIANSGTLDPDTIKVTATVSWQGVNSQLITYLTNWK